MVKGKVALVTGGGSGLGRGTCQVLARYGAKVVAADVNLAGAEETVKSLSGDGHMSLFMDVTSSESIEAGIKVIKERYQGTPTICVNSAGVLKRAPLLSNTDYDYNRMMDINVKGTVYVTKIFCRELVEAELPGSIVNISSIAVRGAENGCLYAATKGAVKSYSKSVAKEFGRYGIRCNVICPGTIDTPMGVFVEPELIAQLIKTTALGRGGKPEEVGELITFLASEKSSYVTGACIFIDGGL